MKKETLKRLQEIGFSKNEAKVYVVLLAKNPMSGYEIAKNTDITRTMIYDILKRLVQKEAVVEIEANPKLYIPVSYKDLLETYKEEVLSNIEFLEKEFEDLESEKKSNSYLLNIESYEDMIKEIKHMINSAKKEIYISLWEEEGNIFKDNLKKAHDRGIKIISFSYGRLPYNFGIIYQYRFPMDMVKEIWYRRRISIVVDRECILLGEGNEKIEEISVITSNTMLMELAISQLILDIIQFYVIKDRNILPENLEDANVYKKCMYDFYKELGIDFDKIPKRLDED